MGTADFSVRNIPLRDKRQVAASFSRAAVSYDRVAGLQRAVADRLASWLEPQLMPQLGRQATDCVLDLGSGTGYSLSALRASCPTAQLLSLDLAEGMLRHAQPRQRRYGAAPLCADAEQLPLADRSVDLIWSSLAIQWCQHPVRLFDELWRVLKPGGRLLLSTLGPATLHELRQAWAGVDQDPHVNEFIPLPHLLACADGFRVSRTEQECRVLYYQALLSLMQELKALGAHNLNPRQRRGLSGRAVLSRLEQGYEAFRHADGLPATYDVQYIELIKE